jgi:hypothetical protein
LTAHWKIAACDGFGVAAGNVEQSPWATAPAFARQSFNDFAEELEILGEIGPKA